MSTVVAEGVVEEVRLILTDIGVNSNKFWHGKRYANNSVTTEWGRVGDSGQSNTKQFNSPEAACKYFETKQREKEKKGYSVQRTVGAAPVKVDASSLIDASDDTKSLIDYLIKVNIHNITALTTIHFDVASGSFETPLGVVTEDGIAEAEDLLGVIGSYVESHAWGASGLASSINQYMRIVPSDIGRRRVEPQALYPDIAAVQAQQQILDALRASLKALEARPADPTTPNHRAKITLVPDDKAAGSALFRKILRLYTGSTNTRHVSASLRLLKVYEIEIKGMTTAFESDGAKLSNIMELWHGTRAANLLSIMNSGYVVPRPGGSIATTGRMFGDGVYFSDQSTKSLNYSAGYWGGGRTDKAFMLLNDVAMGKAYIPPRSFSGGCRPGYDSTFAKAQQSGVINNEMIVYRTSQIKPKYLCEFGS